MDARAKRMQINMSLGVPLTVALERVRAVVAEGRISGDDGRKQFCYATAWKDGIVVEARYSRKGTDTFYVYTEEERNRKESADAA